MKLLGLGAAVLGVSLVSLVAVGCGGSSIEGKWSENIAGIALTVDFGADGKLSETITSLGVQGVTCTGDITMGGVEWSATSSTLTMQGTPTCSGKLVCTQKNGSTETADCSKMSSAMALMTSCSYALSNNGDTMTLSNCTGASTNGAVGSAVLTRVK